MRIFTTADPINEQALGAELTMLKNLQKFLNYLASLETIANKKKSQRWYLLMEGLVNGVETQFIVLICIYKLVANIPYSFAIITGESLEGERFSVVSVSGRNYRGVPEIFNYISASEGVDLSLIVGEENLGRAVTLGNLAPESGSVTYTPTEITKDQSELMKKLIAEVFISNPNQPSITISSNYGLKYTLTRIQNKGGEFISVTYSQNGTLTNCLLFFIINLEVYKGNMEFTTCSTPDSPVKLGSARFYPQNFINALLAHLGLEVPNLDDFIPGFGEVEG